MTADLPSSTPRQRFSMPILLLTLCFVLAACLAIYAVFLTQHTSQALQSLTQTLEQEKQNKNHFVTDLATMREAQASIQTELTQLNHQITAQQDFKTQNKRWIAEQAQHYLELAQSEIESDHPDITTCESLIKQAQKLLISMRDDTLLPVQDAISKALKSFSTLPHLNLAQVFRQIYQLENNLYAAMYPSNIVSEPPPTLPSDSTWQTHLQRSLETLKGLITIKQHDVSSLPEVTLQHMILMNRVALNLQEVALALSTRNPTIYQLALKQAQTNVNTAFDEASPIRQSMLTGLKKLANVPLAPRLPSLNEPLDALNQWMETYVGTAVKNEG